MKKTLTIMLPALAAAALCSCMSSAPAKEAVESLTASGMTEENAAGTYTLTSFVLGGGSEDALGTADYDKENTVFTLDKDGTYDFRVTTKDGTSEESDGYYNIADNGTVMLWNTKPTEEMIGKRGKNKDTEIFLVTADETIICNGSDISITGKLNPQSSVGMQFTNTAKAKAEEAKKSEEKTDDNKNNKTKEPDVTEKSKSDDDQASDGNN